MTRIRTPAQARGFTLIEALIALLILGFAMAAAMGSFFYVNRSERIHSVQSNLDVDARMVIERLRRDLWLSARDHIVLYPEGPGPYTAISFPVVRDLDPDAPVPLDEEGRIAWDTTLVYHLWEGPPAQLRITRFFPRAPLSPEDRRAQLAQVVAEGTGRQAAFGSEAPATRVLIRNLVEWGLDVTRARFDGYAPTPGRRNRVGLGSAVIDAGTQQYTFRVVDRHPESQGYRMGLDALTVSPTGVPREAEAQRVLYELTRPVPVVEFLPGGIWSGNHRLVLPATAAHDQLTLAMDHDRWEEGNFLATGVRLDGTEVTFVTFDDDETLTPPPSVSQHEGTSVVQLEGKGRVWEASSQTGDPSGVGDEASSLSRAAVRVVLRGSELLQGGWIAFEGQNAWVGFRSAAEDRRLRIVEAWIAECAHPADPNRLMDIAPGTERQLFFDGQPDAVVEGERESDLADILIEREKSYVVSFLVRHEGLPAPHGYPRIWTPPEGAGGFPSSFVIPGERAPTIEDLRAPVWSSRADVAPTPSVLAVEYVFSGHPPEGTYTTQIFDTRVAQPVFHSFDWNAVVPEEAKLEIRARSGAQPDLSDAPDWDAAPLCVPGLRPPLDHRYVQLQARLTPGIDSRTTPRLVDFVLDWEGETRIVDLAAAFSTGPDHGTVEVLVNGTPLFRGVTVDLTVFRDLTLGARTRRLTASVFTEVVPRNTGR